MSLPSYMRPEQPQGETPQFTIGEQLEVNITNIEETTGEYGKQLQIDGTLPARSGWRARAWIKYYPVPAPNQYLGKLCLAIQRVTGQEFSSLDGAIAAIKSHGRIFFSVKGFKEYEGKQYPKFAVSPDTLPGEQPQQTKPKLPQKPLAGPPQSLDERMGDWVKRHIDFVGKGVPTHAYNSLENDEIQWLIDKGLIYDGGDGYPFLSQAAQKYV